MKALFNRNGNRNGLLARFREQEVGNISLSLQFNKWSRTMMMLMIREKETELVASGIAVEDDSESSADFWTGIQ